MQRAREAVSSRPWTEKSGQVTTHNPEADTHDEQIGVPWREWHIKAVKGHRLPRSMHETPYRTAAENVADSQR